MQTKTQPGKHQIPTALCLVSGAGDKIIWAPEGLCSSSSVEWSTRPLSYPAQHLACLFLLQSTMFLDAPTSRSLQFYLGFSFIDSHSEISGLFAGIQTLPYTVWSQEVSGIGLQDSMGPSILHLSCL